MGCDIHANLERTFDEKPNKDSQYFNIARDLDIDRHYELFGYLAGVRNHEVKPLAEQRGIPANASSETKEDYEDWGRDAHSASWFTFAELEQLPEHLKDEPYYLAAQKYAERYGEDSVRLVFWFDN